MRIELLAGLLLVTVAPAWAQPAAQVAGYCGPMWANWGWMMMGPLPMIIFLAMLIALVVIAVRWFSQGASRPSALDLLNERYARGEIDKTEYDQKKRDLGA